MVPFQKPNLTNAESTLWDLFFWVFWVFNVLYVRKGSAKEPFLHTFVIVRLIRTISLQFIVESQTWYQNDRGVMLISNQSDAKIIGLGSRVIIGLNWPLY